MKTYAIVILAGLSLATAAAAQMPLPQPTMTIDQQKQAQIDAINKNAAMQVCRATANAQFQKDNAAAIKALNDKRVASFAVCNPK